MQCVSPHGACSAGAMAREAGRPSRAAQRPANPTLCALLDRCRCCAGCSRQHWATRQPSWWTSTPSTASRWGKGAHVVGVGGRLIWGLKGAAASVAPDIPVALGGAPAQTLFCMTSTAATVCAALLPPSSAAWLPPLPTRRAVRRTWPSSPPCARSAATRASALWPTSGASTWASRARGEKHCWSD